MLSDLEGVDVSRDLVVLADFELAQDLILAGDLAFLHEDLDGETRAPTDDGYGVTGVDRRELVF